MPFFLPLRIYLLRKLLKLWDNNHNLLIPLDMYKKKKILTWARTTRFTFLWKCPEVLPQISVNTKALCIPLSIKKKWAT